MASLSTWLPLLIYIGGTVLIIRYLLNLLKRREHINRKSFFLTFLPHTLNRSEQMSSSEKL